MRKLTVYVATMVLVVFFWSCASSGAANPAGPAFIGDGGKGMSIAILVPKAAGLEQDQAYLPALVQGEFVSNFSGYSAISVLDRQRLDEQYAELLSGYYDDNAEAGLDLGHLTPTEYIMGGSVTRTATGYTLQISITKSADKITAASWSGTCTFAELDDLSGIRRASLDLLQKMGVALTEQAKTELSGAADSRQVNAQTALAQGITAQKSGNAVASLALYYQAAQYDPRLKEAAARVNQLAALVRTGSLGDDIRNDIAWREQWIKLYRKAYAYIEAHPDALVEFAYSPRLKQKSVDYDKRTVTFSADVRWKAIKEPPTWRMLDDLDAGLKATGRNKRFAGEFLSGAWGIEEGWDNELRKKIFYRYYRANANLYNDQGRCIGKGRSMECAIAIHARDQVYNMFHRRNLVVSRDSFGGIGEIKFVVPANDITDNMTIKIVDIKEYDREYRHFRSGPSIIPVSVMR